ncbi:DUF6088 family protein [Empedobacter falsenii]
MTETSKNQIETKISKSPFGEIFFLDDFNDYGSSNNVRKVLLCLELEKTEKRIAHGIYLKPKKDPFLGTIYPTTEEIAKQIALNELLF